MSMLKNRRVVCIAAETTPGTPAVLSSANAIFATEAMIQPALQMNKRDYLGTIGELAGVPGSRGAKASLSFELAGGGTVAQPAWASLMLPACAMVSSANTSTGAATYSTTSSPGLMRTVTIGVYQETPTGAVFKVAAGCMGNLKIDAETGKYGTAKFEMEGVWVPPVDATMVTRPAAGVAPLRFAQAGFTIGSYAPKIAKIGFDLGNKIKLREDINTISGYASAIVTHRAVKGSIDPEADSVGNWDPNGLMLAATTQAMTMTLGTVSGNKITIAAPAFQFDDDQEANRDDLVTNDIKFGLAQVLGDDEFTISFA